MTDRRALTRVPIHPPIADRWSPRAFDPGATLDAEQVIGLLEAARWAATWGRRQPVRFVVGLRGDSTFEELSALLKRGNAYAKSAGALILVGVDEGEDENTARYAHVDAGAAMANMAIEAVARGLITHPMAGFDVEGASDAFAVPPGVRPVAVVAVGALAAPGTASPEVAERDGAARERAALEEIAFAGTWGRPWSADD
ncbi:MAG TPA: nitroreductase family protein [Mycobacterium sp.]|uniref:nitroreductase family protein n=1 Tax=Mycolicibacterium sp. TaxID=2320850 RepID=UPI0025D9E611|nr:nitroreductase family protein [Mycolicibacterium sp.]HPX36621.1 nitroreductase family protein [Mycobacterium sp.]HQC76766.1 nitroreductase family protein [Mycobacterium sp.]